MKAVIQRVSSASVEIGGTVTGSIGDGFLVLLGVGRDDTSQDAALLASKVRKLRIFQDGDGKMNLSLEDTGGCLGGCDVGA